MLQRATSRGKGRRPAPILPRRGRDLKGGAKRALVGWSFVGPATLVILGLSIFPAAWGFYISQLKWDLITSPRAIGFRNYEKVLSDPTFWGSVEHTMFFSLLYVPTSVVLGLSVAMLLNRPIRFIGFYRTAIFTPFVASAAAIGILATYIFDGQYGFLNNFLTTIGIPAQKFLEDASQAMGVIAVMMLWASLGFVVVVYLAALQDIPKDLVEAALIDGANTRQIFRHVIWPELMPVTVFATIWQLIGAIQVFDIIYTTTKGGPYGSTKTMVYYVYDAAFGKQYYGQGAAASYVLFAFTLIITLGMFIYSRFAKIRAF